MTTALELARKRYSCRGYLDRPIGAVEREALGEVLHTLRAGPLGSTCRFVLVAATQDDRDALRGLGTYGFIKGATGFIVGAVRPGSGDMEDYGYCLEQAVLAATDLDLGSCWLGGTFTKSSFARKIDAQEDEVTPAVVSVGYPAEDSKNGRLRRAVGADRRLPADQLFFDGAPDKPLAPPPTGTLTDLLETVRWAPSASNKQPWRLLRDGDDWHLYLERTPGYRGGLVKSLIGVADLQRVDMGIAMSHFELAARDAGVAGSWVVRRPDAPVPSLEWEYTATWVTGSSR